MRGRKSSGWHDSAVAQKRKRGTRSDSRRGDGLWRGLLGVFRIGRRQPPTSRARSVSKASTRSRQGSFANERTGSVRLSDRAIRKSLKRRWRRLSPSEVLIWIAVGAVSIAFLLLMAQSVPYLAVAVFILLVIIAWRELGER